MIAYIGEEWPQEQVGSALSVYVAGTVVGGFSGRFLGGLIATHLGWRWVFVVLGGLNLVFAIATAAWLPLATQFKPVQDLKTGIMNILEHLRNPRLLAIYGVGFCILFSLIASFTYVTFYLAGPPFHLGTSALGSIFFVYLIGAVITPVAGKIIDRTDSRFALALSLFCTVIGITLMLAPWLGIVILGLALCSSGVFVCQTLTNRAIGHVAGKSRASAVGLYVSFYYFGGFVGSVVPSFLWNWRGWPACAEFIAAVVILAIFFVLAVWRKVEAGAPTGPLQVRRRVHP